MSLTVRTNINAMVAADHLGRTTRSLGDTIERISSGARINRAADDAAGLGVATNLETASISTRQAIRNANDGVSMIQTAESASNEVTDILQRMRELAVQSSSETLGDDERAYIQDEYIELADEIGRISDATEFNGMQLSDGTVSTVSVQVGIANATSSRISMTLGDLAATTLGVDTTAVAMDTVTDARSAIDSIDVALDSVNGYRSALGAVQNRLDSAIANAETYAESLGSAESQIMDTDFAQETSEMTKLQIMQQAGVAALSQAKGMNQSVVSLLG